MRTVRWSMLLLVACAVGCSESAPAPAPESNTTAAAADTPAPASVSVDIKSWDAVQQWVASQAGKPVVIDIWSTSCLACMKEFPHFVEMHERLGDKVACASLSIDFYGGEGNAPEDALPRIERFLTSQNSAMPNFVSSDPDEVVLGQIDAALIPVALVYDKEGKLHTVFKNDDDTYGSEGFGYRSHIGPLVEQLLTEA